MLKTFHEDPKELHQFMETGHPKSPLKLNKVEAEYPFKCDVL